MRREKNKIAASKCRNKKRDIVKTTRQVLAFQRGQGFAHCGTICSTYLSSVMFLGANNFSTPQQYDAFNHDNSQLESEINILKKEKRMLLQTLNTHDCVMDRVGLIESPLI